MLRRRWNVCDTSRRWHWQVPAIVVVQYFLYGELISKAKAACLSFCCLGVGWATVEDVEISAAGLAVLGVWVPLAACHKIFTSKLIKAEVSLPIWSHYPPV